MSRSVITCQQCRTTIAEKRRVGHIKVKPGVSVVLVSGGARLTCTCGAVRVVIVRSDETGALICSRHRQASRSPLSTTE